MHAAYVTVTLLASLAGGPAAAADFAGHPCATGQADGLGVPRSWMRPLGALLAAGALGLLAGLAVPVLGAPAAAGLVLYFLGALAVHLRAGDRHLGPWSVFFVLAVAALGLDPVCRAG
ncbi:DoxX family protein [Streptomyces sp. NPDC046831]|uniref:DoxX family protein n=1 Tax=Streptomyces sp. NPDC046831 TaxID=3154805 RepID=UPI0033D23600